jgi:hypothetical protein
MVPGSAPARRLALPPHVRCPVRLWVVHDQHVASNRGQGLLDERHECRAVRRAAERQGPDHAMSQPRGLVSLF